MWIIMAKVYLLWFVLWCNDFWLYTRQQEFPSQLGYSVQNTSSRRYVKSTSLRFKSRTPSSDSLSVTKGASFRESFRRRNWKSVFYPSDMVNTKTTIPLRIYTQSFASRYISTTIHNSPPLRGIVIYIYTVWNLMFVKQRWIHRSRAKYIYMEEKNK